MLIIIAQTVHAMCSTRLILEKQPNLLEGIDALTLDAASGTLLMDVHDNDPGR
jgi:hypothetical protein